MTEWRRTGGMNSNASGASDVGGNVRLRARFVKRCRAIDESAAPLVSSARLA
jgi:hypothetical protein